MKTFTASLITLLLTLAALPAMAREAVSVNAFDLIGKVYAVADPRSSEADLRATVSDRFDAAPEREGEAEWLASEDGFLIVYEGMSPEAEAMARYERGEVAGYGYVFYFPYEAMGREKANSNQCEFCSCLLQELSDMGMVLGSDLSTDALFNVSGAFNGGDVQLTLREEVENETESPELMAGMIPADREGQFVLIVSVVPANALNFTAEVAE